MSVIGDYTQPDISVGYYNNNINNVGYRRLHTAGYLSRYYNNNINKVGYRRLHTFGYLMNYFNLAGCVVDD